MPAVPISSREQYIKAIEVLDRVGGAWHGVGDEARYLLVNLAQYAALVEAGVATPTENGTPDRVKKWRESPVEAGITSTADKELTPLKCWEIARALIVREDDLINERLKWFLTLQGLLFAAFGTGFGVYADPQKSASRLELFFLLVLIGLVGLVSAVYARKAIQNARTAIAKVLAWWGASVGAKENNFPPLIGREPRAGGFKNPSAAEVPYFVFFSWVIIMLGFALFAALSLYLKER